MHALAREADPAGARTIGVLTKADAIEEGCHGPYTAVMLGEAFPLKLVCLVTLIAGACRLCSHVCAAGA